MEFEMDHMPCAGIINKKEALRPFLATDSIQLIFNAAFQIVKNISSIILINGVLLVMSSYPSTALSDIDDRRFYRVLNDFYNHGYLYTSWYPTVAGAGLDACNQVADFTADATGSGPYECSYAGDPYPAFYQCSCINNDGTEFLWGPWVAKTIQCNPGRMIHDLDNTTGTNNEICMPIPDSNGDLGIDDTSFDKDCSAGPLMSGNPVQLTSGNKHQQETDIKIAGISNIKFTRIYNNQSNILNSGNVGHGWRHNYESRIIGFDDENIYMLRQNGNSYLLNGSAMNGEYGRRGTVLKKMNDFWIYSKGDGEKEYYDNFGYLNKVVRIGGVEIDLFYDEERRLIEVKDSFDKGITFQYENPTSNKIVSISDSNGAIYKYSYDIAGRLIAVIFPDATTESDADNPVRVYHYEDINDPNALTGITDGNGIRYATWTYDDQGRAISSEHAGGADRTDLTYNADGATTVTNPMGKQTTYHYQTINGAKRVTQVEGHPSANCQGANKAYTYNSYGFIETKTDWNGITTTYTRDSAGREINRTEATGTPQARVIPNVA
ncbi:MAG: RHS repeat protein [gamma proteobacterium endosymbiont of Lamellibrachia anaximandri]|nr:RHS repeat protein [gamma proteobacterium endosymbiont of Lamellibrachia anaximandri]